VRRKIIINCLRSKAVGNTSISFLLDKMKLEKKKTVEIQNICAVRYISM